MKREYQKPYLAVESFQLNAAIAASCTSEKKSAIHYGLDDCWLGDQEGEPDDVYFGNACVVDLNNNDEGLCYQGPIGNYSESFVAS